MWHNGTHTLSPLSCDTASVIPTHSILSLSLSLLSHLGLGRNGHNDIPSKSYPISKDIEDNASKPVYSSTSYFVKHKPRFAESKLANHNLKTREPYALFGSIARVGKRVNSIYFKLDHSGCGSQRAELI